MPNTGEIPMRRQSREARNDICVDYPATFPAKPTCFIEWPRSAPRSALGRPTPPNGNFPIKIVIETGPDPPQARRGLQMAICQLNL